MYVPARRADRLAARAAGRDGRLARIEIVAVREDPAEDGAPRLRLACGVVKGRRWEYALEKAVELGVHEIVPLLSEHGVVEPGRGRREAVCGDFSLTPTATPRGCRQIGSLTGSPLRRPAPL